METKDLIAYASMAAQAAIDVAALFTKAITAANDGDEAAANAYLADARAHWDRAVSDWQAAGTVEPAPAPVPPAEPTA